MRFADGPVWSLEDFLLFSDTVTDTQHKFTPGKSVSEIGSRPGGVSAGNAYIDEKGNLYTCEFPRPACHAHGQERQDGRDRIPLLKGKRLFMLRTM